MFTNISTTSQPCLAGAEQHWPTGRMGERIEKEMKQISYVPGRVEPTLALGASEMGGQGCAFAVRSCM